MTKIKVLIADDHTILRQGIRALLEAEPEIEVVGEASDGREAVEKTKALAPDIVLMDISMPVMNGLEATRHIRRMSPNTQIIVLTMHENEEFVVQMLNAGASGYVLKRIAADELVAAIRSVYQDGTFLHPTIAKKLVKDYLRLASEEQRRSTSSGLTDREQEILKLIAEGNTNKQIAERLCLSIKTVQTHRTHIMDKLGAHDRTELVKFAIRKGLVSIDT